VFVGITVVDGRPVVQAKTIAIVGNPPPISEPLRKAIQSTLDSITNGRTVASATIDDNGLHITYKR